MRKLKVLAAGMVMLAACAAIGVPVAASATPAAAASAACRHTFVPAYPWSSTFWTRAIGSKPAPGVMILNVTGTGAGTAAVPELGYYKTLASYIHKVNPGSVIWLNVGAYPARGYMSAGNVVVAFEGSYASYRGQRVPSWTSHYRARRFADVIYATPASDRAGAVSLSRHRRIGSLFVTNLAGSPDPYSALPSYWSKEVSDVAASVAGCTG